MNPKRILFVLPSLGRGGAEMHTLRLINELDRSAFAPVLACARGGGDYESKLHPDVVFQPLCGRNVRSATLGCLFAILPLARLLRREPFDLCCAVLPQSLVLLSRAMRLAGVRVPIVTLVQNNPAGDIRTADFVARLTWHNGEFPKAMEKSVAVVALSEGVRTDVIQRFPALERRVFAIPNIGCEPGMLVREPGKAPPREHPGGFLLVACGRLEEQKDYPTLLRAVAKAREEIDVRLWILGRGRLEETLRALCRELAIEPAVEFLGFQSDPCAWMAAADLFVLSSRWEGFGNVIVEAMASGAPVLSTDCPFGPREILADGRYGQLVPVGDPDAMAAGIVRLAADAAGRFAMAAAGRERARDFLPRRIAGQYEEVFRSLGREVLDPAVGGGENK